MPTASVEGLFLALLLFLMAGTVSARPRRRFCENFPFAPRCLGVAAKREAIMPHSQTDLHLKQIIEKLLSTRAEDSEHRDNWQNTDNKEILDPYEVLTNLINEKMSTSRTNQKRNSEFWDDFEMPRK